MTGVVGDLIRDALTRIVRVLDALADGEYDYAICIVEELELDLRSALQSGTGVHRE